MNAKKQSKQAKKHADQSLKHIKEKCCFLSSIQVEFMFNILTSPSYRIDFVQHLQLALIRRKIILDECNLQAQQNSLLRNYFLKVP